MIAIGMDFSAADQAAFTAQMNRLIDVAMKEPKVAVRMGAVALLTSLRTSTKTSKKIAPVRTSKSGRGRRVDGKRIFYVERYDRDGKLYRRTIFANSLAEAKQDRSAQIFYHGLAKASWGWTMHRLFPNKAAPKAGFREPPNIIEATQTGDGRDYTISITNDLDYITKAFRTSGKTSVATAMRRAAGTMKGRIDKRIKGARW